MGQIIFRNLDDQIIDRLKQRARAAGSSLEQVARDALAVAALRDLQALVDFAAEMRTRTADRKP
jgi:plasmid stability protein